MDILDCNARERACENWRACRRYWALPTSVFMCTVCKSLNIFHTRKELEKHSMMTNPKFRFAARRLKLKPLKLPWKVQAVQITNH